jgi:hypothetical protein
VRPEIKVLYYYYLDCSSCWRAKDVEASKAEYFIRQIIWQNIYISRFDDAIKTCVADAMIRKGFLGFDHFKDM